MNEKEPPWVNDKKVIAAQIRFVRDLQTIFDWVPEDELSDDLWLIKKIWEDRTEAWLDKNYPLKEE